MRVVFFLLIALSPPTALAADFFLLDQDCKTAGSPPDKMDIQLKEGSKTVWSCVRVSKKIKCDFLDSLKTLKKIGNLELDLAADSPPMMLMKSQSGNIQVAINQTERRYTHAQVNFIEAGILISKNCVGRYLTESDVKAMAEK